MATFCPSSLRRGRLDLHRHWCFLVLMVREPLRHHRIFCENIIDLFQSFTGDLCKYQSSFKPCVRTNSIRLVDLPLGT